MKTINKTFKKIFTLKFLELAILAILLILVSLKLIKPKLVFAQYSGGCFLNSDCGTNQYCSGANQRNNTTGTCVCNSTTPTNCGTYCTNTSGNSSNCGSCGTSCGVNQTCQNGTCINNCVPACSGCQVCNTTTGTCYDSNAQCSLTVWGQTCSNGSCSCPTGQTTCGTSCTNTNSDNNNCGGCGTKCSSSQTCSNGICVSSITCPSGQTNCGGTCTNTVTNSSNCGSCGNVCSSGTSCQYGSCLSGSTPTPTPTGGGGNITPTPTPTGGGGVTPTPTPTFTCNAQNVGKPCAQPSGTFCQLINGNYTCSAFGSCSTCSATRTNTSCDGSVNPCQNKTDINGVMTCNGVTGTCPCKTIACSTGSGYTSPTSTTANYTPNPDTCVKTITGQVQEDLSCNGTLNGKIISGTNLGLAGAKSFSVQSDASGFSLLELLPSSSNYSLSVTSLPSSINNNPPGISPANPSYYQLSYNGKLNPVNSNYNFNLDTVPNQINVGICEYYPININVFVVYPNGTKIKYTASDLKNNISVSPKNPNEGTIYSLGNGSYAIYPLRSGSYSVSFINPPQGYTLKNISPSSVNVGPAANVEIDLAPKSCSISGYVYVGANQSSTMPYTGNVTVNASSSYTQPLSAISTSQGFIFNNLSCQASYNLTLNPPGGYSLIQNSPNPVSFPPGQTSANFNFWIEPYCTTNLSCGNCSASCNGTQSCSYTAFPTGSACIPTSFSQPCGGACYPISGSVKDNSCLNNSRPVNNAQLFLDQGATRISSAVTGSDGLYSLSNITQGSYSLTLNLPSLNNNSLSKYRVVSINGVTAFSPTYSFDLNGNLSVNYCIDNVSPWFGTTSGDVRMPALINPVPPNQSISTGFDNNYSLLFSSINSAQIQSGNANAKGAGQNDWIINSEYGSSASLTPSSPVNARGITSYSFYKARAGQLGLTIQSLPCTDNTPCSLSNLSGIYQFTGQNLIISGYQHPQGKRVIILADNKVTLKTKIKVPAGTGNVLVIASHDDMHVDQSVGEANPASFNTDLEGIFTTEGSFIPDSNNSSCQDGKTADLRLNVGGAVIANALYPFSTSGTGAVAYANRSLCAKDDKQNPVLFVSARPDFITQLTDFYKETIFQWREANPQ